MNSTGGVGESRPLFFGSQPSSPRGRCDTATSCGVPLGIEEVAATIHAPRCGLPSGQSVGPERIVGGPAEQPELPRKPPAFE